MKSVPETKTSRLIQDVNDLAREERRNEIALARIKREAEALLPYDRDGAFMVLGAVSGLLGDEKALHRYHNLSIDSATDKAEAYFNYATSLIWVEDYSSALEILQKSFALEPSVATLERMIYCTQNLGLTSLMEFYFREKQKLTGEPAKDFEKSTFSSVIRDEIMDILDQDIAEHGDLWKDLAKV